MTDNFLKQLKELKKIQPEPGYSRRSKALIMANQKEKKENWLIGLAEVFYGAKFKTIAGVSIISLMAIMGGFYYANKAGENDLVAKANEINSSIQVNLYEIENNLETQPDLNPLIIPNVQKLLEEATDELKQASELSNEPDKMKESLEKIESAQEKFRQINQFFE